VQAIAGDDVVIVTTSKFDACTGRKVVSEPSSLAACMVPKARSGTGVLLDP